MFCQFSFAAHYGNFVKIQLCFSLCFGQIAQPTLVYRIDVQYEINVQGEFFLKINKRADQNKAVQGGIFSQN